MTRLRIAPMLSMLVLAACAPAPDTVLINGRIFTANAAQPWADALAIRGERVVAVGGAADVAARAGRATRRIDLGGRTVVPGLVDASVSIGEAGPGGVRALAAAALARGVTAMQVFAVGRPVAAVAQAIIDARVPQRVRLYRMPEPDATGVNRDSRPYFPPQPTPRLDVRGMGFEFAPFDPGRLAQAVGWAYGSEDQLSVRCESDAELARYLEALDERGLPTVWTAKRPRVRATFAIPAAAFGRVSALGLVVVHAPGDAAALRSLSEAGVRLALGSGAAPAGLGLVQWASAGVAEGERLTREAAVTAATRGAAYADFGDRERGHLSVGALADLAVLSADVFAVPAAEIGEIRSVLTLMSGRTVYETGVVR
jgi:hypothetical protein